MKNELSLPNSWQMKTLGDLFEITSSKRVFKEDWKTEGVPFYRAREIVKLAENGFVNNELFISEEMFKEYSEKYGLPKEDDIMVTGVGTLGICYVVKSDDRFYFKDGNIIWLKSNGKANSRYVEYAFKSDFLRKQIDDSVGATVGTYTIIKAKSTKIPLPPLPEQQRIVSILDEAFAAIAKAKANAEQNLKNAKELFESYLQGVFEKKGDGWKEQLLEDCFKMKSGDNLTAKNMTEGEYPVFGGNGIAGYHNEYNLSGSNVIIGRVGALCGNVRHITEKIWLTDNAFKVVDFKFDFDHSFLTYLLNYKDLRSYARQAAQPVISNSSLKDVVLNFPKSIETQKTIVRQLDALRAETQKLEAVYQKKIADLEELKKSILQKAFAGELKTEKAVAV